MKKFLLIILIKADSTMNAFQELFRVYQSSYPIKQTDSPQTQKHFFAFAYFDEVTLYSLFIYAICAVPGKISEVSKTIYSHKVSGFI